MQENQVHHINEIIPLIKGNYKIAGNENATFDNAKTINEGNESSICWMSNNIGNVDAILGTADFSILICNHNSPEKILKNNPGRCVISVPEPRMVFLEIVSNFFKPKFDYGIHPSAIIHPEAKIDTNSYIGPNTYVGKSTIGKNCILHGNNFIYDHVQLNNDVIIHAGAILGADGFGFQKNDENAWEKFEHIGGIVIEENVEIGANTCIDRGTLGNTLIGKGTKIDNLVHIAHNVSIGKNCCIVANCAIGGSVKIGDNSWIGHQSCILQKINIGSDVVIGMGSVVTKNIPDNQTWAGNPAREIQELKNMLDKMKNL